MEYQNLNRIGKALEVIGATGVALVVNFDLPLYASLIPVLSFCYGLELRDRAIEKARFFGIIETLDATGGMIRINQKNLSDKC